MHAKKRALNHILILLLGKSNNGFIVQNTHPAGKPTVYKSPCIIIIQNFA